jgi:hypothetical protein
MSPSLYIIIIIIIIIHLFQGLGSLACFVIVLSLLVQCGFLYVYVLPIGNLIESLEVCFFFQTVYLSFIKYKYNISSIATLVRVKIEVKIVPVRSLMARKLMKV